MSDQEVLLSDEFRRLVEENLERDPMRIALDGRVPHAALVASQVKYLRRAASKLPSWFAARCIVPPLAFEQSSSEAAAARRADYSGALAVDLTCGLGVDAYWLSKRFEKVIALECDGELAAITQENFRRLGAHNIAVINTSAEEFLSGADISADLVYADPDRRNPKGKKMVRIEDCSPDITALLPQIRRIAPRLVVKMSPMFDVDEVFRVFGPHTRAEVVSLGGECKEIVAEVADDITVPTLRVVAMGVGEVEYPANDGRQALKQTPEQTSERTSGQAFEAEKYRYLVIPDVALQKARLARRDFSEPGRNVYIDSDNGYGFSTENPGNIMGKTLEIESIEPFDPKELKRRLRAQNIKNIAILKRDFPLSAADIARQLGVREGGTTKIAFTRAAGKLLQIILK